MCLVSLFASCLFWFISLLVRVCFLWFVYFDVYGFAVFLVVLVFGFGVVKVLVCLFYLL